MGNPTEVLAISTSFWKPQRSVEENRVAVKVEGSRTTEKELPYCLEQQCL